MQSRCRGDAFPPLRALRRLGLALDVGQIREQAHAEEEARLRAAAEARAAARAEAKAHARAARRNKIGGGGHDAESVAASSSTVGSLPMGGGNSGVLPGHRVGISAAAAKEKLLRFGDFDLDELKDEVGRNCLHAAAAAGHAKACAVAVKQGGMAINKKTIYGFTPLMLAASWGREVPQPCLLRIPRSVYA